MKLFLGYVPAVEHAQPGHPESPQRMAAVMELLQSKDIDSKVNKVDITIAGLEQIGFVHSDRMIRRLRRASDEGGGYLDADTYATEDSFSLALAAAGTTVHLVNLIMDSTADRGFALIRPPGHHAERDRVGGFCLFNNIAIAARQAQKEYGAERVLIVDIDVHHGNGTQDIFYDDPSVMYISLHQFGGFFYPGTGAIEDVGAGPGHGYNINIPFPPGAGDHWYLAAAEEIIIPIAGDFSPNIILVSAGFDAHWIDPLASERLSLTGYSNLVEKLIQLADDLCGGRILVVLEGGYHSTALSHGALNTVYRLMGTEDLSDPLGPSPQPEHDMTNVLAQLRDLHLLN